MTAPSSSLKSAANGLVQVRDFDVHADVTGEGHLGDAGEQAAVGAVVVGEDLPVAAELLDGLPEILLEVGGVVDVWRGPAHLRDEV